MQEILRDSIWQFIGAILAALAIIASYWFYRSEKKIKELAFGIITERKLLQIDEHVAQRVKVTLDDAPVEQLNLIVLGVKNSGNTPILKEDFTKPMSINLENNARIISAQVSTQNPENIEVQISKIKENKIEIDPLLLNPLESFTVQILTSSDDAKPKAEARIIGISRLENITKKPPSSQIIQSITSWAFGPSILLIGIYQLTTALTYKGIIKEEYLITSVNFLAISGVVFAIVSEIKNRFGANARRHLGES